MEKQRLEVFHLHHGIACKYHSAYSTVDERQCDARHSSLHNEQVIVPFIYPEFRPYKKDTRGSDGSTIKGKRIEVRTIGLGNLKFQLNRDVGSKRSCSLEQLTESFAERDYFIIVDTTPSPIFKLVKIPASIPAAWVRQGEVTPSGISAKKLWKLLAEEYNLIRVDR